MEERFSRVAYLAGEEGMRRLRQARIAVFGLGGVGSFAAEALVRSGIGFLRLVDFDRLGPSNLNRQILALHSTLGQPKTEVARQRFEDISPDVVIETHQGFFAHESADQLLAPPLDFVIDAIDSLNPKTELIATCHQRQIPIFSCLGAAARNDPTAIRVGDIEETRNCPLARFLRQRLHRRGVRGGIPTVSSTEPPAKPHPALQATLDLEDEPPQRGRPRNLLPSLCSIPAIFGMIAASYVIDRLLYPDRPPFASE